MLRYTLASVLLSACSTLAAAPVPRQAPPKAITAEMMLGTWEYAWSNYHNGVITFDASGSYVAVHVPGSNMIYSGTWKVEDDAVTISEYAHDLDTSAQTGPREFVFQFAAKDYPKLAGLSNGAQPVALRRPKN